MLFDPQSDSLCLVGGGEHAKVVAEAIRARGAHQVKGFWGVKPEGEFAYLGDDAALRRRFFSEWQEMGFHLALMGSPHRPLRRRVFEGLADLPMKWEAIVHPHAWVSPSVRIGAGAFVGAGAIVQVDAVLGPHVLVNTGAIVEHDVRVGLGAHLAPGSVIGGGVEIGDWAWLGLGCRVRDHVRIGEGAVVAMGAVVTSDVPPGAWFAGTPARPMTTDQTHA